MARRLLAVGAFMLFLAVAAFSFADVRKPAAELDAGPADGPLIVKATINGKEARLEIDTGSPQTCIQPSSAIRLGIVPPGFTLPKAGYLHLFTTIDAGGVKYVNEEVWVTQMFVDDKKKPLDYQQYDGLLGLSTLKSGAIGLDLVNRKVAIWPGGLLSDEDAEAWIGAKPKSAPLSTVPFKGYDYFRITAGLNGQSGDFILDTGSPMMILTQSEAKSLRKEASSGISFQFVGFNGSAGLKVTDDLELPWRSITTPMACVLPRSNRYGSVIGSPTTAGLIGFDSLEGTRTVIDFRKRQISSAVCADWVAWEDWLGSFGFRLMTCSIKGQPDYAGFTVTVKGAAAKAGIQFGDMAVEIDGLKADLDLPTKPPSGWQPGPTLTVKFRRDGRESVVILRR